MKKEHLIFLLFLFSYQIKTWQSKPIKLALNTTSAFGKKHFIIGYKPSKKATSVVRKEISACSQKLIDTNGRINTALFAPNDDLRTALLYLIEQEKKHISIAMFTFTDKEFAQALAQAQLRGIHVEIIVDPSNVYGRYNKLGALHNGRVNILVYNPNRFNKKVPGAMHNKFIVFEKNINNKSIIWTGSFNFTRAAHQRNQENVVVLDHAAMVQKFTDQFQELKKYADQYRAPIPAMQMIAVR